MRHAPPVSVSCHGRGWRRAQAAVYGLAGAAVAAWATQHLVEGPHAGVAALGAATLAFVFAAGFALRQLAVATRTLVWDGRQWLAGGEAQQVGLMLQTGSFLLLRLRAAPRKTTWLAVERTEAGPAWHGLLVALHATSPLEPQMAEGQGG